MKVNGKRLYFDTLEEGYKNLREEEILYYSKVISRHFVKLPRMSIITHWLNKIRNTWNWFRYGS